MEIIYRYGKGGKKLGLLDVLRTRDNSEFKFKTENGDKAVMVNYLRENKFKYQIDIKSENIRMDFKNKGDLEVGLAKLLGNLGFIGKDIKSAIFRFKTNQIKEQIGSNFVGGLDFGNPCSCDENEEETKIEDPTNQHKEIKEKGISSNLSNDKESKNALNFIKSSIKHYLNKKWPKKNKDEEDNLFPDVKSIVNGIKNNGIDSLKKYAISSGLQRSVFGPFFDKDGIGKCVLKLNFNDLEVNPDYNKVEEYRFNQAKKLGNPLQLAKSRVVLNSRENGDVLIMEYAEPFSDINIVDQNIGKNKDIYDFLKALIEGNIEIDGDQKRVSTNLIKEGKISKNNLIAQSIENGTYIADSLTSLNFGLHEDGRILFIDYAGFDHNDYSFDGKLEKEPFNKMVF